MNATDTGKFYICQHCGKLHYGEPVKWFCEDCRRLGRQATPHPCGHVVIRQGFCRRCGAHFELIKRGN